MEIQKAVNQKKELYNILLEFIENNGINEIDFQNLIDFMQDEKIEENQEELELFLLLLLNLSNDHHRDSYFFDKIEKIILYLQDDIKQTFSNAKIYDIFQSNKRILLFLFDKNIIIFDESIFNQIKNESNSNGNKYSHFFYPEIKSFLSSEKVKKIEKKLLNFDSNIFNDFEKKRQEGENESFICSLIRNDSVEEFISYVNKTNLSLKIFIKRSIFETNSFLLEKEEISLIEYAAFFGAIQIFQYLRINGVELESSLWFYVIHSENADLIHLLEESHVMPPDDSYEKCLLEAIKCHHDDIARYIENNLLASNFSMNENCIDCCFRYSNYSFFPADFEKNLGMYYLCNYNYSEIFKLFMEMRKDDIEAFII